MTASQVYFEALRLGLRLEARGSKLAVIPGDRVPAELVAELRQHKAEMLAWLDRPPCPGFQATPPDDLPLNGTVPRPTPKDRERVIAYMVRQGCDHPGTLGAWLATREASYFDGPGRHWDCGLLAYASARDAACWQLSRTEAAVLELLAGFDECKPDTAT